MLYRPKSRTSPLVDLSPLIDVVFLLLIFFMVSTTFKDDHGLDLDLPDANSITDSKSENLMVFISKDGQIKIGNTPVSSEELPIKIKEELPNFEQKMVVFKIDENVNYGVVVRAMDAVKGAGAEGITFAARGNTNPSP